MSKNYTKERILVTGGAGFVGSHIAKTLVERGYDVVVFDNVSRGSREAVPVGVTFVKGDLRSKIDINKAMEGVDRVIHCAAMLVIPESFKNPSKFLEVNIVGTFNLLEAMIEYGVKSLVFSSSAGVYGEDNISPITEDGTLNPYSPYGDSKLAMEHVMHAFHMARNMDVTVLRYFNPYGPGYLSEPEHVVPVFFEKALKNEDFPVYGDGSMERDYIYIGDLVDAHLLAMKQSGYNLYNVGGGCGVSIREMAETIIDVTGSKSKLVEVETPKGYPHQMYADISKIKRELGWEPKTSLTEGIQKTFDGQYNDIEVIVKYKTKRNKQKELATLKLKTTS